jgi:membrane-associated phospholipid phosphatase
MSLTCFIFMLMPATTAWTHSGQEALAARILPDLPTTTNSWLNDLMQIRSGLGRHIVKPSGIIAFPSFHCASAVLNAWAVWKVRAARWPFLAVNLLMIAATPLIGGHYVADLIGGTAVAGVTIATVHALHRWLRSAKWLRLPAWKGWSGQEHLLPH